MDAVSLGLMGFTAKSVGKKNRPSTHKLGGIGIVASFAKTVELHQK